MPRTASVILRVFQVLLVGSLQQPLRIDRPCTQDLRRNASQDTIRPEQRSLEERGRIYRTGCSPKERRRLTAFLAVQRIRSPAGHLATYKGKSAGSAKAVASVTIPRMPDHPTTRAPPVEGTAIPD